MQFDGSGAATGAITGAGIGAFGGPIGIGIGTVAGGLAGGLGLFGSKPKRQNVDISAEMAKISALFDAQRKATTDAINYEAAQGRTAAASNLAARGIYRSPASQNTFSALDNNRVNAIAQALGQISGQEAQTQGGLLAKLLSMNNDNVNADYANAQAGRSALFSQLGGLGSSLLLRGLGTPGSTVVPNASTSGYAPSTRSPSNTNAFAQALFAKNF